MLKVYKAGLVLALLFIFGSSSILADDQDRKRDRKRDGSCKGYLMELDSGVILADDQDRKRDRKRDGSCKG